MKGQEEKTSDEEEKKSPKLQTQKAKEDKKKEETKEKEQEIVLAVEETQSPIFSMGEITPSEELSPHPTLDTSTRSDAQKTEPPSPPPSDLKPGTAGNTIYSFNLLFIGLFICFFILIIVRREDFEERGRT